MSIHNTTANRAKLALLAAAWKAALSQALRRGFHGTVTVEICVQDGTIQNIKRRTERIEK